ADRMTSTFWIVGECKGKIRSTPCPNDTLRTVNDARVPPRCIPITTPSKIWIRSLSPSRTFTCTLTVSPAFIAGRSASCDFSTSSIAPIVPPHNCRKEGLQNCRKDLTRLPVLQCCNLSFLQFPKHLPLFVVQTRVGQQIRPPLQRPRQRLTFAPTADLRVVAGKQHVRH